MTKRKDPAKLLIVAIMLFYFSAFALIAAKELPAGQFGALTLAFAVPIIVWIGTMILPKLFPGDKLLLSLVNFLCALGVLVLYSTDPSNGIRQCVNYSVGVIAMVTCVFIIRSIKKWEPLAYVLIPLTLFFLASPLLLGKEINGAKNWIYISGISLQPSEIAKVLYIVILAHFMSRRKMLPWLILSIGCMGILMLQKDLGTALVYYVTTLFLFYASTSNIPLTVLGVAGGAGAAVVGYQMFAHVKKRVAIWLNPWSDTLGSSYQIVQSLIAIANGGLFGVGLGLGNPTTIPIYYTDMIFAVICEQFGLIFALCILMMYILITARGFYIAADARHGFHGLIAMGSVVVIAFQTFLIVGGVIKLIPLTGVTMPFVSYGGSSLVSSLCIVGLLQGVGSINEEDIKEDTALATMLIAQETP
ncbi:MAG: FtsW/RodA/SpoVE family cell cycle protein [Clostridiales bacterium]|nr:FtsW/RodA/SpoVE family cell cycle protein [Clostridiales bacterium]